MQSQVTDEILVARIQKGDISAFRMLVVRYQNLVFTMALRIVGSREDAEEVAQDVFMKVYANLASFEGKSKLSSWIYRIAHNSALTKIRNHRPDISSLDNEKVSTVVGNMKGTAVYNTAEQTFRAEDVSKAISMLEPEDATIITLFYLSEQSIDEIGQILHIESNAAKVRLHRARKKLREKMETNELI